MARLDAAGGRGGVRRLPRADRNAAYRSTPGNVGAWILRHDQGERTKFVTLTFWESVDAIHGFAGDDVERAVFYAEDDRFLVERDETVTHWQPDRERGSAATQDRLRGR